MIKIGGRCAGGIAVHSLRDGRAACDAAASREMEWTHNDYTLTDDPDRIDFAELCSLLWGTYWAETRGREVIERSVRRSLSFALLRGGKLAGFARVVTDAATVGYLCDFVIGEAHRGAGIGQWMLTQILAHPDLRGCRIDLFTRDTQEFYKPFGFGPHKFTSMVRYPPRETRDESEA
jgi:ribosomal protein S18 acetylase RimI-like enzyme